MVKKSAPKNILDSDLSEGSNIKLKYHIYFWSCYFLINTLRWGNYHDDYSYSVQTNLLGFPLHMALSYINAYFLMPKFIYKKMYVKYIMFLFLCLFGVLILKYNLTFYLVSQDVFPEGPDNGFTIKYMISTVIGELYVIAFTAAIKLTVDWIHNVNKLNALRKLHLKSELKYLRSQINPHFFFNTLNNLYSLTLEKSNKAPEVVLKLSELMKYILYDTKKSKQSLTNEILHIQNYLELEKLRYDDRVKINMSVSGSIEDKKIDTMILIPFIENCFKHGANKSVDQIKIDIDCTIKGDRLFFKTENTLPAKKTNNNNFSPVGGIGIKNVKKRLKLGYKKDEYDLKIRRGSKSYKVLLKIKV